MSLTPRNQASSVIALLIAVSVKYIILIDSLRVLLSLVIGNHQLSEDFHLSHLEVVIHLELLLSNHQKVDSYLVCRHLKELTLYSVL